MEISLYDLAFCELLPKLAFTRRYLIDKRQARLKKNLEIITFSAIKSLKNDCKLIKKLIPECMYCRTVLPFLH